MEPVNANVGSCYLLKLWSCFFKMCVFFFAVFNWVSLNALLSLSFALRLSTLLQVDRLFTYSLFFKSLLAFDPRHLRNLALSELTLMTFTTKKHCCKPAFAFSSFNILVAHFSKDGYAVLNIYYNYQFQMAMDHTKTILDICQ